MAIDSKNVKLFGPRVLITIDKRDNGNKLNNGLYVPDSSVTDAFPIDTATVLAVGDGYWQAGVKIPLPISVGDRIILPTMAPKVEVEIDNGKKAYIVSDAEIAASI